MVRSGKKSNKTGTSKVDARSKAQKIFKKLRNQILGIE